MNLERVVRKYYLTTEDGEDAEKAYYHGILPCVLSVLCG
jgi:hypothetical protein